MNTQATAINKDELNKLILQVESKAIPDIINLRNSFEVGSFGWQVLEYIKSEKMLENKKYMEKISYVPDDDLEEIFRYDEIYHAGFDNLIHLKNIKLETATRAVLEYNNTCRQFVTSAIILNQRGEYLFLRKNDKTTEKRLINSLGIPSGHLNAKCVPMENMIKELYEELNITSHNITKIKELFLLRPIMKDPYSVTNEHVFVVYSIELNDYDVTANESDIECVWCNTEKILKEMKNLDDVCQRVFRELISTGNA